MQLVQQHLYHDHDIKLVKGYLYLCTTTVCSCHSWDCWSCDFCSQLGYVWVLCQHMCTSSRCVLAHPLSVTMEMCVTIAMPAWLY